MIIFLYGQDSYRSRKKLNEIIDHYKKIHQSGLNLKYFNGKELNFEDFRDEIQQTSMFDEKKLAILEDTFSNKQFKEKFLKYSKEFINSKNMPNDIEAVFRVFKNNLLHFFLRGINCEFIQDILFFLKTQ